MTKEIRMELDDDQYEWVRELKDRRGFTWKGMMLEGAKRLDSDESG